MRLMRQAAVIGGGVIGGGWIARFLLMGVDVKVFDPDPEAERKIKEVLSNARRSLPSLYDYALPTEGALSFADSVPVVVKNADWICECVPERLELKQTVYQEIQRHCDSEAIIASSTSGFTPSQLQAGSHNPQQIIVAHPFNPVYLLPLVELVGNQEVAERAQTILSQLGFKPIIVRKEIDAHIGDRLLEAVWREALWLINDGIATTEEIDDVIRFGFGLRWAQMGLFETYRIAGGEAGMAHFIEQFGPALKWPWTKLMDVPELSDELVNRIAEQSDTQSGRYGIRQLERIRDDNLVAMLRALKRQNWGAGRLLNAIDASMTLERQPQVPMLTAERVVPTDWTDYNGHMNDSRYCEAFSVAGDELLKALGADQDYLAAGFSYFTVDMQISFRQECHAGDTFKIFTRISLSDGKKLRLEHQMLSNKNEILARCDQFLLHVSLSSRRSCQAESPHAEQLATLAPQHLAIDSLLG